MKTREALTRGLILILAVSLLAGVLMGCGTKGATTEPVETAEEAAETSKPEEVEEVEEVEEIEEVTVKIGWSQIDTINEDGIGDFLKEKFKLTFEPVSVEADNINLMAVSGDLPDMFDSVYGLGKSTYNSLKSEGFLREIPDAMVDNYPILKDYIETNETTMAYKEVEGSLYSIPRRSDFFFPDESMEFAIYYRADWLEKVGLPIPTNMDEFYEVLKAFTTQDPDGNGEDDTYGLTGWLWQIHYIAWSDLYNWVQEPDGTWVPGYMADEMLESLKFWNKLYKEGILDPEFSVADPTQMFTSSKTGVYYHKSGEYWYWRNYIRNFTPAFPEQDVMELIKIMPPLAKDAGSEPRWPGKLQDGCTLFNSEVDDVKLDRVLQFYDWALSAEGQDFAKYGFKDLDYAINEEGKAASLLPYNNGVQTALWDKYPSINLFGMVAYNYKPATPEINPFIPEDFTAAVEQLKGEVYGPAAVKPNLMVEAIDVPAKETCTATVDAAEARFIELVATEGDIEAEYEAFRTEMLQTFGLQDVIDQVNAYIAENGIN